MALSVTNLGIDGLENIEQIGTGGSSRVYRANQVDLDRVVAIKVLNPGDDQGVAKRFDRERKAMGRLSLHEGIVPVYSSGVTAHGEPYLVMPYYANGSLQDQIDAGPMEWETAVSYVDVAADTIAAAHDEGVVHLDLKPANILLTNTGAPRIADFGIARLTGATAAGITAGTAFTPAYSAPETFLDGETGPPSDVYGLGATLWALLVGHPPFLTPGDDSNLMAVIGRVVNNQVGDLRHIAPAAICEVVERAMSKRPQDRYQTAREFSLSLKQAAAGASVNFVPPHEPANPATTLFPGVVTSHHPAGAVSDDSVPFPAPERPVPVEAAPRTLLQETAQPLPKPMGPPPGVAPTPIIDLDRFRPGPLLLGGLAFLLIVGAATWAFFRDTEGGTAAEQTQTTLDPASPSTEQTSSLSTDGTIGTPTTAGSDASSTSVSVSSPTSSVTTANSSATTGSSSTTEASSTTTTESTTTTTASTTTSESTTTTTSTTVGPPSAPTGLTASAQSDTSVQLAWNAPGSGPDPASYIVLRNGVKIRENLTQPGYVDRGLDPGTYTYQVRAVGENGQLSPTSNSATITAGPLAINTFTVNRTTAGRASVSFSATRCVTYRISAISDGADDPSPVIGPATGCTEADQVPIAPLDPTATYQFNLVVDDGTDQVSRIVRNVAPPAG